MILGHVLYFDGNIRLYGVKINLGDLNIPHTFLERNEIQRSFDREPNNYADRERNLRLERRWKFLASIDDDPIVIDGHVFRFDWKLYTNTL